MALLIILILLALLVLFGKRARRTQTIRNDKQSQTDELIAVILPTIRDDK